MRFHTATHLLCAIIPHQTNGCSITSTYARLDFDMVEPLDREHLERELARLVAEAHGVSTVWITARSFAYTDKIACPASACSKSALGSQVENWSNESRGAC